MKDAADFWDREVVQAFYRSWMADPHVREYINTSIGGDGGCWPMDWLAREYGGRQFTRALSIGCGAGPLERDLIHRNLCQSIDAFDGSSVSIELAKKEAEVAGLGNRIHYFVADFNEPNFPTNTYDAVFFNQSAHHVAKLEKLFRAVLLALKPEGIVYLDEFIGPSRTDWNHGLLSPLASLYQSLPREIRLYDELPLPIQHDDPSEGIRSSEILEQLKIGFEVEQVRGYGGNVLSVLFFALRELPEALVHQLIRTEREWLTAGQAPYYAIIVARRKGGLRAMIASARYFLEPKAIRVLREARRLFS